MQFDEVKPEHFSTVSRDPFPHTQIDHALLQLAGGGQKASQFRKEVLELAGWKHHNLTPLGKYPEEASAAYNRIRTALADAKRPEQVFANLKSI